MWNEGWDKIFADHQWGSYPPEELVRFVARNFGGRNPRHDVHLLEVGCGPGANICFMAREGYTVSGIDGSQVAIDRAKQRLAKENLTANLHVGDVMRLPFADASVDGVMDIECIYANSVEDTKEILKEIKRVLKPNGLFFSKTFMAGMSENVLKQGYGLIRYTTEEDIQSLYGAFFTIEAIDYICRSDKNRTQEVKEWLITCRPRIM